MTSQPSPAQMHAATAAANAAIFAHLSDEQLADVWYALCGEEIRHPGYFSALLAAANDALFGRLGEGLAPFIEARFRELRASDVLDDAAANAKVSTGA